MKTQTNIFLSLFVCGLFCLNACNNKVKNTEPEIIEKCTLAACNLYQNDDYITFFTHFITTTEIDTAVVNFYKGRNFTPLFTKNGYDKEKIDTLLFFLQNINEHGLPAKMFDCKQLATINDSIKNYPFSTSDSLYSALCSFEKLLILNCLRYEKAISYGIVSAAQANSGKWSYKMLTPDSAFRQSCFTGMESLPQFLNSIQPTDFQYIALQKELKKILAASDSIFPAIIFAEADSGKAKPLVREIARRLAFFQLFDTTQCAGDTLNSTVLNALNRFRAKHAIPASSKLDKETVNALNRNPQFYIDKIRANLERLRWKRQQQKAENYIAVNLADFYLRAYLGDTLFVQMKICCGSTENAADKIKERTLPNKIIAGADRESPMTYGEISRLVLNPQWNVPGSIIEKEYYELLKKDARKFLQKEAMTVLDKKGNVVNIDSVDWATINPEKFPYQLVQKAGRGGALGIIKFHFNNSHGVYLHDTPSQYAFTYRNRAVSHGCIRVEKPMELANMLFVLNAFTNFQIEKILIDLGEKPKTKEGKQYLENKEKKEKEYYEKLSPEKKAIYQKKRPSHIDLEKKMPLFIEYYTCFAAENGDVNYRNDVYYKDVNLLRLLSETRFFH